MVGDQQANSGTISNTCVLRQVIAPAPDFEQYVTVVGRAVRQLARHYWLRADEADDLQSEVWIKLLADRGLALRRFKGRARLTTYLMRVARNVLLDRRTREWGKWRPSRRAQRYGEVGIELDRLISRDGLSMEQAILSLAGPCVALGELRALAEALPRRSRRFVVSERALDACVARGAGPDETLRGGECLRRAPLVTERLASALATLTPDERMFLTWRYAENRRVAEIAKMTGVDQKRLFREYAALHRKLRIMLVGAGVTEQVVHDLTVDGAGYVGQVLRSRAAAAPLRRRA
jgi:RNA polymerase sigma factor (sigma-70 family)